MADEGGLRPTLLIGVGGTGSRIAQNVFKKISEKMDTDSARLQVLAFDTDENDNRRLKGLDKRQAIRFSTTDTIDQLLDQNSDVERNWFVIPRKSLPMELRQMNLLDGAGQVRMLSRLALHDSAKSGNTENSIGSALSALARYDNRTDFEGQVNVLIVGSLAGATGSGSFLQVASLVRDIATKRNISVGVRGIFLMPDIYVRSGALPAGQIPSVLANGYASLKEFHAATMKATDRADRYDFDFEFAPGRSLKSGEIPFASLTLIDYENMQGENLGRSIPAYSKVAERAAYTLLFTPIGGKADSVTVNDVRETVSAAGKGTHNRIAAIGISALSYPHEEIIDYLAGKAAKEVLSGDWLRLDDQFRDGLKRFRDAKAAGDTSSDEPQQASSYLEDLMHLALTDKVPFFREIYENLNPSEADELGDLPKPMVEAYLQEFDKYVVESFWNTKDVKASRERSSISNDSFASTENIGEEVRQKESNLESDYRIVERNLSNKPTDIVVNLAATSDGLGPNDWRPHHIQYWMIKDGPHPVQSRAFLFGLKILLEERLANISSEAEKLRLYRLANSFRSDDENKKEPEERSTPNLFTQANEVAERNSISRLFKGGPKEFVDSFVTYHNSTLQTLRRYAESRVRENAYGRLLLEVQEQLRVINGLFTEIGSSLEILDRRILKNEEQHEKTALDENTLFICANAQCKKALWEEIQNAMAGQRLAPEANANLITMIYETGRRNLNSRHPEALDNLRQSFQDIVVEGFAKRRMIEDFGSIHDMNIVEALRKEADILNTNVVELTRNAIDIVERQASTLVSLQSPNNGQSIQFWAFNSSLRDQLSAIDDPDKLFSPSGQGVQTVEEVEFDTRELLSVSLHVNLELSHLAKLNPPFSSDGSAAPDRAGRYYQEYRNMVDELIDATADGRVPNTITPHIHRDWHIPGHLPEISSVVTENLLIEVTRSFVSAITLDALHLETSHGRNIATIRTSGLLKRGGLSAELTESHDLFDILRSFEMRPDAVRSCNMLWDEMRDVTSGGNGVIGGDSILSSKSDTMERILLISRTRRDTDFRDSRVSELIAGFAYLIQDHLVATKPTLPVDIVIQETEGALQHISEVVFERLGRNIEEESLRIARDLYFKGIEKWRELNGP